MTPWSHRANAPASRQVRRNPHSQHGDDTRADQRTFSAARNAYDSQKPAGRQAAQYFLDLPVPAEEPRCVPLVEWSEARIWIHAASNRSVHADCTPRPRSTKPIT